MKEHKWYARTRHDLIIEVWEALDCESVGAHELNEIQKVTTDKFGAASVDSPASIARIVADEGAVLRHPEVLNLDTEWRERKLSELVSPDELDFSGLAEATSSIEKLDGLRRKFQSNNEQQQLARLLEMTLRLKQDALMVARSKTVERKKRLEAKEIAQWLTIWLQTPDVFGDWLSLRQRSPEFSQFRS